MKHLFRNQIISIFLYFVFIIFLQTQDSNAQYQSREKNDSIRDYRNGYWFNPDFYQFEMQYPKLKTVPPLSTEMPYDVMLSYIYLDSLLRMPVGSFHFLARWEQEGKNNDTITAMVKYFNKMIDYDPIRYYQYLNNVSSKYYHQSLNNLTSSEIGILSSILSKNSKKQHALSIINYAAHIFRIKVNSVETAQRIDRPYKKTEKLIHNVYATVIDTLKGRVFSNCNCSILLKQKSTLNEKYHDNYGAKICFTYGQGPYTKGKNDESLLDLSSDYFPKEIQLKPGQELLVTLTYFDYKRDWDFDYLTPTLIYVIPIIDGKVVDWNHDWSDSDKIEYSRWKEIFISKYDALLNGEF